MKVYAKLKKFNVEEGIAFALEESVTGISVVFFCE